MRRSILSRAVASAATAALELKVSPQSAKHARLMRLAQKLASTSSAPSAVPKNEGERMLWVNSHVKRDRDVHLSKEEEALREPLIPLEVQQTNAAVVTGATLSGENLFQFRDFPMFPGEVVPAGHNALASMKGELTMDLTVQSIKDAWFRVAGGITYHSVDDYYRKADGLDEIQLGEVVAALFPTLDGSESQVLVRRCLEAITKPHTSPARQLASRVSAEALGLDNAPDHYTNFLEWMGRMMDTAAFRTEHAIFQFARRKFNRRDIQLMYENYNLMSDTALMQARADGYSHYFEVLKDFSRKVAGEDTRNILGVRIDPQEVDARTGFSFGFGKQDNSEVVAVIRENRDHTGRVFGNGKSLSELTLDRSWVMEHVLWPFDEAGLDYRDFDVYFINKGHVQPLLGSKRWAYAARLALSTALSKLIPLTRIRLKKSGLLSFDRRKQLPDFPGYLNNKTKRRRFVKR